MNFDDVIQFLKTNKVTDEQWEEMYEATRDFDRNLSEEDKHKQTIEDIKKLWLLHQNDFEFRIWCDNVLRMEKFQEYIEDAERKYPEAVNNVKYADTPSENYYIPCLCPGMGWCENGDGNPFLWGSFAYTLFLVRKDWDSLICGESGTSAFAAFWHGKFNTLLTPEFIYDSEHLETELRDPLGGNSKSQEYYKRSMKYDLTLWDFEELKSLYKEAVNDIL